LDKYLKQYQNTGYRYYDASNTLEQYPNPPIFSPDFDVGKILLLLILQGDYNLV